MQTTLNPDILKNRDYTILLDASSSMTRSVGGSSSKTRWKAMQEQTFGLAQQLEKFDPDGLTVIRFAGNVQRFENVTAAKVDQVFESEPNGSTRLDLALKNAFDSFFDRKAKGQLKANGELIVVVTDGEPDDENAVERIIIDAANRIDRDEELAVLFLQAGDDALAAKYLKDRLDDGLQKKGAKFDIVDVRTFQEVGETDITTLLLNAIDG